MRKEYLDLLACIYCRKNDLSLISATPDDLSINEGIIQCNCCNATYPIIEGIPCFLRTELMDDQIKEQLSALKDTLLVTVEQ